MKFNTLHYLIAMLKKYEIKNIVASPGAQNARFNSMIQQDKDFNCFSVVDERSAAYVGLGLARENNSPAVITCTGATASRNYLSAMTEAFYSQTPLIAITFFNSDNCCYSLAPQFVDRSIIQNDIVKTSIQLPLIDTEKDETDCLLLLNEALYRAVYRHEPIHINCPAYNDFENITYELPENIWKIEYYEDDFDDVKSILENKKVGIFIGSHNKFSLKTESAISNFAKSWNMPVFCDYTSNYKGENKILISQIVGMFRLKNLTPDLIIDIGGISGDYTSVNLFKHADIWRIDSSGELKCRCNRPVSKLFACSELIFFSSLINSQKSYNTYYFDIKAKVDSIKYPELPLCYAYICQNLTKYLPENSSLHMSILNPFRNMNFFKLSDTIETSCNVGGFGIDGPVSTVVGQSLIHPEKKFFGLIGDLAFFYDMNIMGQRDIKNNLRILVVNNNGGLEFRISEKMETFLGKQTEVLIAASNHYSNGAKEWAQACNFEYITASTKEDFLKNIDVFCNGNFDKPLLFEVFTKVSEEQDGINLMKNYNRNDIEEGLINCYRTIKSLVK